MSEFTYRPGLHRYCIFVATCTLFLVVAGGMVTSTDSGLAVPDWPLSYGQLMPPMVGGIFYEHGHRMIATFVGLLTIGLAIWTWRVEQRKWVRVLGVAALGAVILQGVLGGLTVLYLLPLWISVSHATLAQSFFSLTLFLAVVTSRTWLQERSSPIPDIHHVRQFALVTLTAVFVQLVLGALMRHANAGMAVPDFPLAYGALWPSLDSASLAAINADRAELGLLPVEGFQVALHLLHRLWAVVVTVLVLLLVRRVFQETRPRVPVRETAIVLGVLVLFQFLLGMLTVWTGKNPAVATAHVALGSLVLGCSVALTSLTTRGYLSRSELGVAPLPAGEPST